MALPDWQRAHGAPLFRATLRATPSDFQVVEELGWSPSGDGEHDYLFIEKIDANTEWVATQLAAHAGVPERDVGYAGLKDRHAVTQQWFSVPRWHGPDWESVAIEGVRVLAVERHLRKLRRGAHDANRFRILLRDPEPFDSAAVEARLATIIALGVPNYFGEQRFGRNGANLQLAEAWAKGKRLSRPKRSLAISTVRSFVFNQALSARVHEATWDQLLPGDTASLEGSASVFAVDAVDDTLRLRCAAMDIHPAAELPGDGSFIGPAHWQVALSKARVEPGHRSLRLRAADLELETSPEGLWLSFRLGRGAYATAVLRELCDW